MFIWSSFPTLCGQGKPPPYFVPERCFPGIIWTGGCQWIGAATRTICKGAHRTSGPGREIAKRRRTRRVAPGWALGSEAFRERMGEMVSALMMQKKRASYAGGELRLHDEQAA
jgi:hypothetical protein